ncbi:hypothetical protein ACFL0D_04355 [Thermoproteota archaeon]
MSGMKQIVESKGVKLYCPQDGRFAFFNSPFPSHKENSGVDIYPNDDFGGLAPSPVDGEVIMIRRVKAPKGHGFEAADHDTVILIQNRDNPETVTKILHIDPLVEIGDRVKIGDSIGVTLRSGYYGWGTSPHIHAEVRSQSDPIRARGGYKLALIDVPNSGPLEKIAGEVVHIQPEFTFIKLNTQSIGLVGTVNGKPATLDGGIPYYGWLGAHIRDAPETGTIELIDKPIANITQKFNNSCKAICRDYQFFVQGEPILGLSLKLWLNPGPLVKVIPLKRNSIRVSVGDWVEVELRVA